MKLLRSAATAMAVAASLLGAAAPTSASAQTPVTLAGWGGVTQEAVIGKLLKHVGPDNILWGTDSIWYGSPQDQIESFRAFEISEELQERYGYPALTPEVKRKIFGLNAAALHGLDPKAGACRFDPGELQEVRLRNGRKNTTFGPATATAVKLLQAQGEPWEAGTR